MRFAAFISLAVLLSAGAGNAQTTTYCTPVGNTVMCNTTAPPANDSGLGQSEANFGSALGGLIERIRERREAEAEERREQAAAAAAANKPTPEQLDAEVRAFAADPAHPYFYAEKDRMVVLLQNNQAQTLQQAYDMALAEDPAIQAALAKSAPAH